MLCETSVIIWEFLINVELKASYKYNLNNLFSYNHTMVDMNNKSYSFSYSLWENDVARTSGLVFYRRVDSIKQFP